MFSPPSSSSPSPHQSQPQTPELMSNPSYNGTNNGLFSSQISFSEILLQEVVGKGTFGVVRRAFWNDKVVAVKLIETEQERKAFMIELRQLSRVSHPNIVRLYGATSQPVSLVMEYAEGGSLYNVLHATSVSYTLSHCISWVLQCAKGVSYLHNMNPPLVHRDLKPPNLLLVNGGTSLKICDFGTACDKHTHMTNSKGSAAWMAPEVFQGSTYSEKCDVFSWGVIFWEVLARRKPFGEYNGPAFQIMWAVHNGKRPNLLQKCPKFIDKLITSCWAQLADDRPSMDEVVKKVTYLAKFCGDHSHEPIVTGDMNRSGDDSVFSTQNFSVSHYMQTQFTAVPQQTRVVTDQVLDPSRSNVMASASIIQSKIQPPLSVVPNIGLNANYPPSSSQLMQQFSPIRRSSEVNMNNPIITVTSGVNDPNAYIKGHKRSSSSGAQVPVSSSKSSSQSPSPLQLNKSCTSLSTNEDTSNMNALIPNSNASYGRHHSVSHLDRNRRYSPSSSGYSSEAQSNHSNIPERELERSPSDEFNNVYQVLEARLQPLDPDTRNQESMSIFEVHKKCSQEYLKSQMEVHLLLERKQELERLQRATIGEMNLQQVLDDYWSLKTENDQLFQFRKQLLEQRRIIKNKLKQKEEEKEAEKDGFIYIHK